MAIIPALVTTDEELQQIYSLNQLNLKSGLSEEERKQEGFVTWLYSLDLLKKLHLLSPSVICKDGNHLAGYALTTLRESLTFHADLDNMIKSIDPLIYKGKQLKEYSYYCMGQICIDKAYRGKGIVELLYQKHKLEYGKQFDLLVTEISTSNTRSIKAHERIGFKTIHTHIDKLDTWNVVVWDWT